ncbi:VirB4 family type IV secretion system protein [Deinococcus gobiensis]|uniref:Type IV secretory pathway VirB4 component, ATPase TRAC n=1 Tax=Deinococcus gobiensis (strain DSM 21396 / JCM 16679 / CGMCC 1.7299 / I-0) TaxID=745776 RepID=H8H1W4_DEIGI|nr:DUF87 domain-containing protein [Deinococcus gobiensis]AFD27511.1 Type IV secretory pathway VirB4 component, ATPase TRAC [Deinococcus gobiensis I-0]
MPYHDVVAATRVADAMGNLTEKLTYQGLKDGVAFSLDNKLSFGLTVQLVSAASATLDRRIGTRDRLMRAVQGSLPVGAVVRFYLENRPSTPTDLAQHGPVRKDGSILEQLLVGNFNVLERMRQKGYVSTAEAYLTVTLPVPGRPKKTPYRPEQIAPLIEKAHMIQQRLARQLSVNGMTAQVMTTEQVWGRIMDYHNPSMASTPKPVYQAQFDAADLGGVRVLRKFKNNPKVTKPYVASMRAQVACSDVDLDYDSCFMLGLNRVGVVSFLKPTRNSAIGCTDQILQALGGTHSTLMIEYLVVDVPKVRAEINESLDKQTTAADDPSMKAGREVYSRIATGTALMQELESGQVLTEMSMHAMIYARTQDELDERRERTLAAFSAVGGCMPRVASSGQAIILFLQNAPFSGQRSSYQTGAYYQNAVDCIPQVGPWSGNAKGVLPFRTRSGNVFSITPRALRNAGVVVMAKAGSGKSVLINMLSSGLVHNHDASLTVVDPKRDYLPLFMALGALHSVITVAPNARLPNGKRVCINPFDLPLGETTAGAEKVAYLLELMRALRINDGSGRRISILIEAITVFYRKFSAPQMVNGEEVLVYTGGGTLTGFVDVLRFLNTVGDQSVQSHPLLKQEVSNMANDLRAYTGTTPLGTILDGLTTVDLDSRYLYLDISGMMQYDAMKAIGALLTNELVLQRALRLKGVKVVVQEEGGVARELPELVNITNRLFKTGRSLGIIPILSVQNIEDAQAYAGVINNADTRILLESNPSERAEVARIFELNDAMRALHASLGGEPGRFQEALILQNTSSGGGLNGDVGQLWLSPEAYWMTTSKKEEADLRAQVAEAYFRGDQAAAALYIAQGGDLNATPQHPSFAHSA